MNKIDHVGIAVKDIEKAKEVYTTLLNTSPYKEEIVEEQGVKVAFFKNGDTKVELLEGTSPESAIAKFVAKRGEGVHHIAYSVTNISQEIERLSNEGYKLIDDKPRKGADNKLVAFVHPKSCNGVLIELCEPSIKR